MWSIGIYIGDSPLDLHAPQGHVNPVLTRANVSDVPAKFVADPFMVRGHGSWHMFFEVMNWRTGLGEIGLAVSADGLDWKYRQIVLAEPFHLSYPYVFAWRSEYYMIPETLLAETVRLYKADDFPTRWSYVSSLIEGSCADPSVFRFDDKWWMFVCSPPYEHGTLRLYYANNLLGPWTEHPANPIVARNPRKARPAGRVLVLENKIIRFAQDCEPRYGSQVRAFEISELTTRTYVESENAKSPVLMPCGGDGWNGLGMHHLDPHPMPDGQWISAVDGFSAHE